ncbi:MAG: hypothetical protein KDC85_24350 [Saprospiraceae bacterium]|nr:hypothetical protein [Saprospiraceae bacterium]MCB9326628.1 hypothetical protein [Lewinellaceae bacterium]
MKKSKILMIIGTLFLLGLFVFPLWNITLEAPQYPDPIGMDIWITKITDHQPNDVKNINLMNHYVGMKEIPEHMKEFEVFPWVVGAMIALGLIFAFTGNYKLFLVWFILMVILGIAGMYDFYLWEYDYGHSLNPKAAIKFTTPDGSPMAYQPPLIGSKVILNFRAISLPMAGAYLLFTGMVISLIAFFVGKKEASKAQE